MSQQSQKLMALKTIKPSTKQPSLNQSIKSYYMGSIVGLFFIGAVAGCQTTTGMSPTTSTPQPQSTTAGSKQHSGPSEIQDQKQPLPDYSSTPSPTNQTLDPSGNQQSSNDHASDSLYATLPTESPSKAPAQPPSNSTDHKTTQQILLEQARQNSNQAVHPTPTIKDGSNLPAFKKLMDTGVQQLSKGQISAAEATFTRAQRLGPQSSAVYFYLGQVALKQNQPLKAEAMARRGLVVSKTKSRTRALWQVILKAGQAQGNTKVVKEARAQLSQ